MVSAYQKPYGAAGTHPLNPVNCLNKYLTVARVTYNPTNARYQGGINYLYVEKATDIGVGAYAVYTRFWTNPNGRQVLQDWPQLTDKSLVDPAEFPYSIEYAQAQIVSGDDSLPNAYICLVEPDPTKNRLVFFTGTPAGPSYLPDSYSINFEVHFKKWTPAGGGRS